MRVKNSFRAAALRGGPFAFTFGKAAVEFSFSLYYN